MFTGEEQWVGTPFKDMLWCCYSQSEGKRGCSPRGPQPPQEVPPAHSSPPAFSVLTRQPSCHRSVGSDALTPLTSLESMLWVCPFTCGSSGSSTRKAPRQTWWLIERCVAGGAAGWWELGIENPPSPACPTSSVSGGPTASCMRFPAGLLLGTRNRTHCV